MVPTTGTEPTKAPDRLALTQISQLIYSVMIRLIIASIWNANGSLFNSKGKKLLG